jgi:hypothetical protein
MTGSGSIETRFVTTTLKSWQICVGRAGQVFHSLSDEQMHVEIAPGKNRPIYLLGHLIVVNDSGVNP